jgi:transposase
MFYVGMDVHSKSITICVLDSRGQVAERHRVRQVDHAVSIVRRLSSCQVCYEASSGYGALYELLVPLATRVVVAHPGLLRLIYRSRRKNDRVDAERLAKLLFIDQVPTVHVPPARVRSWREMINFRHRLIAKRTRAKNGLRGLLRNAGIKAPARPGLWTAKGLAWLQSLEFPQPLGALQRDLLVEEIQNLSKQVRRVEAELKRIADNEPAVWQLQSIPGIGLRTAEALVAFLDAPQRFARAKAVGSYLGLVPCQDQSGDSNRLGHITKTGPAVARQLLTEAAWQAIRRSPTVRVWFERVRRNDPDRKKIAIIATAHYLARAMWAMLRDGTVWKEDPALTTADLAWDPKAGRQARPVVPAPPLPVQIRRSPKAVLHPTATE